MRRKKQRRMSKSAAVFIPVSLLLAVMFFIMGISVFLTIMEIEVIGESDYTDDEIILASGISMGDNMLFVDAGDAERQIRALLPFISEARVTRVPPDAIQIEVTSTTALATVAYRNEVLVIDSTGRVLQQVGAAPPGLIEVRGISPLDPAVGSLLRAELGGEPNVLNMRDVLAAIEREGIQDEVSYLDVSRIGAINFGYIGQFRVILGSSSNARSKLAALPDAVEKIIALHHSDVTGDINLAEWMEDNSKWGFQPRLNE